VINNKPRIWRIKNFEKSSKINQFPQISKTNESIYTTKRHHTPFCFGIKRDLFRNNGRKISETTEIKLSAHQYGWEGWVKEMY